VSGIAVTLIERGSTVGAAVRAWSHVKMFSPNAENMSQAGLAALGEFGRPTPSPAVCPTGSEFCDGYLEPLCRWLEEQDDCEVLLHTNVDSVCKGSLLKADTAKRDSEAARELARFSVLVTDTASGDERMIDDVDAVLDCSGTYGRSNFLGCGGMPAIGERALRAEAPSPQHPCDVFLAGIPDCLDADRASFLPRGGARSRRIALVGDGLSAATTLHALMDLAASRHHTFTLEVDWLLRASHARGAPYESLDDDPWPSRARLTEIANEIATASGQGEGESLCVG